MTLSNLIQTWKHKRILWNPSAGMDFSSLLYTHKEYLKKNKIAKQPEIHIYTDFCRNNLENLGLSNIYFRNFKYSREEENLLLQDIDLNDYYQVRRNPLFSRERFYYEYEEYSLKHINFVIFKDIKDNKERTKITLLTSRRIQNDLDIYYKNSKKYTHFPELGLPELVILELKLKIESDVLGKFEQTVYYFFMENVNFLKDFVLHFKLGLSYIYYMIDGCSFGFNNLSNRWILYFLQVLRTDYLIINRSYYGLSLNPDTYMSDSYTSHLFETLLEYDKYFYEVPRSDDRTLKLKKVGLSKRGSVIWLQTISKRSPVIHTRREVLGV